MSQDVGLDPASHTHYLEVRTSLLAKAKNLFRTDKPDLSKLSVCAESIRGQVPESFGLQFLSISNGNGNTSGQSSAASSLKAVSMRRTTNNTLVEKYGSVKSLIGEGGSSVVWLARLKGGKSGLSDQIVAVKCYRAKSIDSEKDFNENLKVEHRILGSLDHRNIIKTFDLLTGMLHNSLLSGEDQPPRAMFCEDLTN